jgi:acetyl-CoA carboxylase biotin carboxyl carrier protein
VDNEELKELMKFIARSSFIEFEMEREGFKLKLVKDVGRHSSAHAGTAHQGGNSLPAAHASAAPPAQVAAPHAGAPVAMAGAAVPSPPAAAADIYQVTSPMVGTFYRASNPNAPPFVQAGDNVKKGQVLCIIEAMKLMNEIESEVSGEIVDIPVSNGQPVEYGEVLFRIRITPA